MKKISIILVSVAILFLSSCGGQDFPGSISVSGDGSVTVAPDTAHLRITVAEKGKTTKEAQNLTNKKIQEVLSALHYAGLEDSDMQTSALRFDNETEWDNDARKTIIIGRIVSQTISVTFSNLDEKPDTLVSTLDSLGNIDGIEIGNLAFSIEDPQEHYIEARRLAFEKAKQKATELANYAEVTLGKASGISEGSSYAAPAGPIMVQSNIMRSYDDSTGGSISSELPGGEITISYSVHVVFETF